MLEGRRFRRLLKDAYVATPVPLTHEVRCRAARLAIPHGVLSHASATVVKGLPLGIVEPEPVKPHVTTPLGCSTADRRGLINHVELLPAWQITTSRLGPVTTAARTFLDRSAEQSLEDLVALGDAALNRKLATKDDLETVLEWGAGRRGVVNARRALRLLDGRAESAMESRARLILVLAGLEWPEVNTDVHDADGEWLARGDLVYRKARLIIEYDGRIHLSEARRRADLRRRNLLTAEGWTVLYVTADDILRHPERFLAMVENLLAG